MVATSSGDAIWAVDDRWVVFDDLDGLGKQAVAFILAGDNGLIGPASVSFDGTIVTWTYEPFFLPRDGAGIVMHMTARGESSR